MDSTEFPFFEGEPFQEKNGVLCFFKKIKPRPPFFVTTPFSERVLFFCFFIVLFFYFVLFP